MRPLYERAARAEEILTLDITYLDLASKGVRVVSRSGKTERVFWQTGTAQLLPRLIAGRTQGPVFLSGRKPTRAVAGSELCPVTGRARPSYRRAGEIFAETTQTCTNCGTALTHAAEPGTNTPMLLARSRHASIHAQPPSFVDVEVSRRYAGTYRARM